MSERWEWNLDYESVLLDTQRDMCWGINKSYSHPEELAAYLNVLEAQVKAGKVLTAALRFELEIAQAGHDVYGEIEEALAVYEATGKEPAK
jgi:hypothetical protein